MKTAPPDSIEARPTQAAWLPAAPTRKHELLGVLAAAALSFGLGCLLERWYGHERGKALVTAAMISAYATPVLSAWPGAWILARLAPPRPATVRSTEGGVEVPRFAVRKRRMYLLERVAFGVLIALPTVWLGEWGLLLLFVGSFSIVPVLWVLMILDLTGWTRLEVREDSIHVGQTILPLSELTAVTLDEEALLLTQGSGPEVPGARRVRVWSRSGRRGHDHLRIIKAAIEAAMAERRAAGPDRE